MSDSQSRKYQITINNPAEKGITHDTIKETLATMQSVVYYCIVSEIGLEAQTPHTHVFIVGKTPIRFSTIKKRFPTAHIEQARGTNIENRDYIQKQGKWANDEKADTSVDGTFEEWGELPEERGQGHRSDIEQLYELITDGKSNAEIMAENPILATHIAKMDKIRTDILEARYRNEWRTLEGFYIFGDTATGKTRGVMEQHGYTNVYRATDYSHPFDRYASQPVLCLDEFRSSLMIGDMLEYLDGYPLTLPARYAPRVACYDTVYIISNIDLRQQYPNIQTEEPETWKAFLRRIHHVIEYRQGQEPIDHGNATDYIFPPPPPTPDWVVKIQEAEKAKQLQLFPKQQNTNKILGEKNNVKKRNYDSKRSNSNKRNTRK